MDDGTPYAYDAAGRKLWQVNLGDKVTRLLPADVNADGVLSDLPTADAPAS